MKNKAGDDSVALKVLGYDTRRWSNLMRQTTVPSNRQCIADDSLTATGVLDVHCDGR